MQHGNNVNTSSPFSHFYEEIFLLATGEQQADFLRQLFAKDASLCASFQSFIEPIVPDIDEEETEKQATSMRQRIIRYRWGCLFNFDPTADEYTEELIQVLQRDFTEMYELQLAACCRVGNLLSALQCLRIIELGTNLDWTAVEEPAAHHPEEISYYVEAVFNDFESYFMNYIFAPQLIEAAQKKALWYLAHPGPIYDYAVRWHGLIDLFGDT